MRKKMKNMLQRFRIAPKSSKIMFKSGVFLFFFIVFLYFLNNSFGYNPLRTTGDLYSPPSMSHIMGTDQLGRDVFSRVCHGVRFSLTIAFIATLISLIIGTPIGALSGYFGGKIDRVFSIILDALYAFPGIILAILISVIVGPGIITTSIAISVEYIPQYFRIVRGLTLSIKERTFIEALRALGARSRDLIFDHILIYAIPSIISIMMLNMGSAILAVSGLGFLGLGLPPPTPEWGTDLGRGRDFITIGVWWTSVFPGLMIVISIVAFTLIGEGLNEIMKTTNRIKM